MNFHDGAKKSEKVDGFFFKTNTSNNNIFITDYIIMIFTAWFLSHI